MIARLRLNLKISTGAADPTQPLAAKPLQFYFLLSYNTKMRCSCRSGRKLWMWHTLALSRCVLAAELLPLGMIALQLSIDYLSLFFLYGAKEPHFLVLFIVLVSLRCDPSNTRMTTLLSLSWPIWLHISLHPPSTLVFVFCFPLCQLVVHFHFLLVSYFFTFYYFSLCLSFTH